MFIYSICTSLMKFGMLQAGDDTGDDLPARPAFVVAELSVAGRVRSQPSSDVIGVAAAAGDVIAGRRRPAVGRLFHERLVVRRHLGDPEPREGISHRLLLQNLYNG